MKKKVGILKHFATAERATEASWNTAVPNVPNHSLMVNMVQAAI